MCAPTLLPMSLSMWVRSVNNGVHQTHDPEKVPALTPPDGWCRFFHLQSRCTLKHGFLCPSAGNVCPIPLTIYLRTAGHCAGVGDIFVTGSLLLLPFLCVIFLFTVQKVFT